ncbi:MAG: class I SAM-dependent methyltransferase [Parvularculaceae bacterium]|nr:class I SAM-dependent methyltransferase [Parvularculaceae bacterium]
MSKDAATGFGDVAARYALLRPSYPKALFDFLETHLQGPRAFAVDLGAGPCKASVDLAARFDRVAAVEPDARMLAAAPDHPRIERLNVASEAAEFPEGSVDCVIAATSFHWMEQDVVCAKVARWLRPGGVFFPFLYGPFFVTGTAQAIFQKHWALWSPFMDKRLGAKADYSRPMRACGAFSRQMSYSGAIEVVLPPEDAAGLLLTASYARAYMASKGLGPAYIDQLADEFAPHTPVTVGFPLGGVLGVLR